MACPFGVDKTEEEENESVPSYSSLLNLPQLLNCFQLKSDVHEEHLFYITHSVYELWFKQILYEIDSLREMFATVSLVDQNMGKVNCRLSRIAKIFSLLIDQIGILETMTAQNFAALRPVLGSSSGLQSYQFRLIENKLGVRNCSRVCYNRTEYEEFLENQDLIDQIKLSEMEHSLADLVAVWLEKISGLRKDFWDHFTVICGKWFLDEKEKAEEEIDQAKKERLLEECNTRQRTFNQMITKEKYEKLLESGDRTFSWTAFKGALLIYYNSDEVQFQVPFQTMTLLMDLDVLLTKWRSAHVLMVQRMIGSKVGTGGSSGYYYLKSTTGDRYRPFIDLFHLSNYLIPGHYVEELKKLFIGL